MYNTFITSFLSILSASQSLLEDIDYDECHSVLKDVHYERSAHELWRQPLTGNAQAHTSMESVTLSARCCSVASLAISISLVNSSFALFLSANLLRSFSPAVADVPCCDNISPA